MPTTTPPDDDSFLAALEHLRRAYEAGLGFAGRLVEVVLRVEGGREIPLPVPGGAAAAKDLSPVEASILAALRQAGRPLKVTAICLKAHLGYTPYVYRVLKRLRRKGLVESDPDRPAHYRLAGSPPGAP